MPRLPLPQRSGTEEEAAANNARATVALTKRRTLGILAGCCALLLGQEEGQGQEDTGGSEDGDMERLSAAMQALLLPPPPPAGAGASGGDEGQPPAPAAAAATAAAAAAAAQMLMLATPPRALPPAVNNSLNPDPGGAAAANRPATRSSTASSSRYSSSAFSTASSLGMSAGGGSGTGRKGGGSISTPSTTTSTSSSRRRRGLGKALAGGMEEEEGEEEGTAATMDVSEAGFSPSPASSPSYSRRSSSSIGAIRSQHRASALLALCCHNGADPMEAVVNDGALVREIMTYLVPPSLAARPLLGQLSLVSPLWRAVSSSDTFWRPVSLALFPALPAALSNPTPTPTTTAQAAPQQQPPPPAPAAPKAPPAPMALASTEEDDGDASPSSPSSVWQEGRSLCKRQVLVVGHALCLPKYRTTSAWQEGLSMMVEVMDERDGKRLFFGSGPVHVAVGQNVILRLAGTSRKETSTPFSAADRDPELHRFQSMKDFFKYSHAQQFPAALRVRVFICDDRSGQVALLYQSSKGTKRHAKSPNASYWQEFLPEHSLYVWDSDQVVYGENAQAKLAAAFYVVPVQTNEDGGDGGDADAGGPTQERDKLFVIAGGDEERYGLHSSYVSIDFSTSDNESVGKFVRSLLVAD